MTPDQFRQLMDAVYYVGSTITWASAVIFLGLGLVTFVLIIHLAERK